MPAQILQDNGSTALVQLPDGRTMEVSMDIAQDIVRKSYEGTGEQAPGQFADYVEQPAQLPQAQMPPVEAPPNPAFQAEWQGAAPQEAGTTPPPQPVQPAVSPGLVSQSVSHGGSFSGQISNEAPITQQAVGGPPQPASPQPYLESVAQGQNIRAQASELSMQAQQGLTQEQSRLSSGVSREYRAAMLAHQRAVEQAATERAQYEQNIADAMSRVASVDPGRIWQNAGSFGSAMGIASAAIGGWLQVIQGGPNHAIEAIHQLMNQDIQAQEVDIQSQREGVFRAERAAERGENYIADRYRQMEEERMMRLQSLIEASKARALQFESPIAQAKHMEFIGALQNEWATAFKNAGDKFYEQRFNTWQGAEAQRHQAEMERQGRAQVSISAMNARTARMAEDRQRNAPKEGDSPILFGNPLKRDGSYWMIDPQIAATTSKEEIGKLRDAEKGFPARADVVQKAKEYVSALHKIGRRFQGPGATSRWAPSAVEVRELRQKYQAFNQPKRHALYGGALTDAEAKNYTSYMPEPEGIKDASTINQAVDFVRLENEGIQSTINTYKMTEVDPSTGQSKPVDVVSDWNIDVGDMKTPDASELRNRMNESAAGISALAVPKAGASFTPSEPPRGKPGAYTGEAPTEKAPKLQPTVKGLLDDAKTWKTYIQKAPQEMGITSDLANTVIKEMRQNAALLDANGYDQESGELFVIAGDIEESLKDLASRKAQQNVKAAERPYTYGR